MSGPEQPPNGGDQPRKNMSCGRELFAVVDLHETVMAATNSGFHFLVIPFIHPRYRREMIKGKALNRNEPLTRSDLILSSQDWNRLIVGKLSDYFEVDSEVEHVRKQSERLFIQELECASHLSLPAIMFKLGPGSNMNLARILNSKMTGGSTYQVWVQIPLQLRQRNEVVEPEDTWEWWNRFRSYCDYDKKVCVALEIGTDLPSDQVIDRWLGEPVKCLILPTKLFLTNQRDFPVLSRAHQELIRKFIAIDVQYVITGRNHHGDISQYFSYIAFLGKKLYHSNAFTEYIQGCEDFLQIPLQPLAENLETLVYEVFEKDPHKYNQYQSAIQLALEDKAKQRRERGNINEPIIVMVVGAGRGPLVRAVLNAEELSGVQVTVYALEKNPHAVNTLLALERELWAGKVTVVAGDMRNFSPSFKTDIIVSELLGSFGDNELSPECLDGAQRFLKDDGISIPCSYTSWIAPIQSLKLYNEIRNSKTSDKTTQNNFETPYVVHIVNNYKIDNSKALFTFHHPNKDDPIDNTRYGVTRFLCPQNCVLTGFAGYFTCDLYRGIMLSTEPRTHTKDMMSWFSIFFPIPEPIQLKPDDTVEIGFWRCVSETKVWYEWAVTQPKTGPINNPNGRSYVINK